MQGRYMKFVKLHQNGHEMLVNLNTVSEIYQHTGSDQSTLFLNFIVDEEQAHFKVDESLDEIHAKMKGN